MKSIMILTLALLILANFSLAVEPLCWDCNYTVEMACGPEDEATLFNLPDGNGSPFTEAQRPDGTVVDCSIIFTIADPFGVPIAHFPAEDMWLESVDGGMVPCVGGNCADSNTDETGTTGWVDPLNAGGASLGLTYIMVNGMSVYESPLALHFNSADLNGDGTVNLADVGMFSSSFFGDYSFGADFFRDGLLNLADVGRLAHGLGGSCP